MSQIRIDPVCGMQVSTTTPYKTIYKGKVYYFCSPQCLKAFRANPDYYLQHGPQGMPGEHSHHHKDH
ncbi:MAG: YHS domain-containing protein [Desulfurococcales archaeon]|nr:YHS domain-containing protein [Desulfurococcales archaeon]